MQAGEQADMPVSPRMWLPTHLPLPACLAPRVQLLGKEDVSKIMRLQFAEMGPHSQIKRHVDTGGYAQLGHRIHIVVQSNPSEWMFPEMGGC